MWFFQETHKTDNDFNDARLYCVIKFQRLYPFLDFMYYTWYFH